MFRTGIRAEQQEKAIMRAKLIAGGIGRFHKFSMLTPKEKEQALQILADELASIGDHDEALAIRASLETCGLQVPEPSAPVYSEDVIALDSTIKPRESKGSNVCAMPQEGQHIYTRRSNRQVSEEVEMHIHELLLRGWNKSAIARALRVNRRVVIRVFREALLQGSKLSAQSARGYNTIDLGKS